MEITATVVITYSSTKGQEQNSTYSPVNLNNLYFKLKFTLYLIDQLFLYILYVNPKRTQEFVFEENKVRDYNELEFTVHKL